MIRRETILSIGQVSIRKAFTGDFIGYFFNCMEIVMNLKIVNHFYLIKNKNTFDNTISI